MQETFRETFKPLHMFMATSSELRTTPAGLRGLLSASLSN